jgi:hypothetical protein
MLTTSLHYLKKVEAMRGIPFTAAAAVTLVLGWVAVGPLFVDQSVDESFKLTTADGSLNMPAIMGLPEPNRRLMRPRIMRAAAKVEQQASEPMPDMPNGPSILASGQFVDADSAHKGSGDAKLYTLESGQHLLRLENFRTTNGPDLVVYLSRHPNPISATDVHNAEFVTLGKLKGNVGNQNYPLPSGTQATEFHSVVIWCELFGVLFSPAALTHTTSG